MTLDGTTQNVLGCAQWDAGSQMQMLFYNDASAFTKGTVAGNAPH